MTVFSEPTPTALLTDEIPRVVQSIRVQSYTAGPTQGVGTVHTYNPGTMTGSETENMRSLLSFVAWVVYSGF